MITEEGGSEASVALEQVEARLAALEAVVFRGRRESPVSPGFAVTEA